MKKECMKDIDKKVLEAIAHSAIWAFVVIFAISVIMPVVQYRSDDELRINIESHRYSQSQKEWSQQTTLMKLRDKIKDCENGAESVRFIAGMATVVNDFYVVCKH